MPIINLITKDFEKFLNKIDARSANSFSKKNIEAVQKIIAAVRKDGDKALKNFTKKFDKVDLIDLAVDPIDLKIAHEQCDEKTLKALRKAIANITEYALTQVPRSRTYKRKNGATLGVRYTPIKRIGVYVPGGRAVYPSSVLMSVVFAKVAGVEQIVVVSPPDQSGSVHPLILAACYEVGVREIYAVGGAQAIAALAYGTESIKAVNKIVGPGNTFVTIAKKEVYGQVGIDKLAGPSESLIIADAKQNPNYLAHDLLIQAEHDPEASSIIITNSLPLAKKVKTLAEKLVLKSPRKEILQKSLSRYGGIIVVPEMHYAAAISNMIAPEHLQLMVDKPYEFLNLLTHVGAVFIGPYTPETVGDYTAGPSHVLPTNGTARFSSPITVMDFLTSTSLVEYSQKALKEEAADLIQLSTVEKLPAHGEAIRARLKKKS
jgi:histidinol dehydrogenase